jgi:hypothetical protein
LIEMLLYKGRSRDEAYILEVLMVQCIPCCYPLAWLQNQCFREQINPCRLKSWDNGRQILQQTAIPVTCSSRSRFQMRPYRQKVIGGSPGKSLKLKLNPNTSRRIIQ